MSETGAISKGSKEGLPRVFSVFDRADKATMTARRKELREKLESFLANDANIPVFPAVVARLQKMLQDPEVDLRDVEKVIKLDPGLASKIMNLSTSSIYGGGEVKSLEQAFQRVGMAQIKQMLFIHGAAQSFKDFKVKANWGHFWLHSILTARMTDKIYYCYASLTGDEYLAGLMHDTGKLFLQRIFPEEYREVLELMKANKISSEQAEYTVFGFGHADVSADLCQRWKMNPLIVTAVKYHHDPAYPDLKDKETCLATCLSVADSLANSCDLQLIEKNSLTEDEIYRLPGWMRLRDFNQVRELTVDVSTELKEVEALTNAIISG